MKVFHGTGDYCLDGILTDGPIFRHRVYHCRKKSFCATSAWAIAELFAIRKTAADAALRGEITGVVLEFEVTGTEGVDYERVKDTRAMQDEHEIAVYNRRRLKLIAIWRYDKKWERKALKAAETHCCGA